MSKNLNVRRVIAVVEKAVAPALKGMLFAKGQIDSELMKDSIYRALAHMADGDDIRKHVSLSVVSTEGSLKAELTGTTALGRIIVQDAKELMAKRRE